MEQFFLGLQVGLAIGLYLHADTRALFVAAMMMLEREEREAKRHQKGRGES